jgi:hypothetical protein
MDKIQIAICYWGLTRSTKKVYQSHYENLFDVLSKNNYMYDVFIHTWKTEENLINEKMPDIEIDYGEYKLLSPNYYQLDNQSDFLSSITFSDYFNEELYNTYGDSPFEWRPKLIRNHLCALESQKRVTNMMLESEKKYKYVIYIRPDVMINDMFDINFLSLDKKQIAIPNFNHFEGYNDRFAIMNYDECLIYASRIDNIIEYKKNNGRIVSEKYLKYTIDNYFDMVIFINFNFTIIRP